MVNSPPTLARTSRFEEAQSVSNVHTSLGAISLKIYLIISGPYSSMNALHYSTITNDNTITVKYDNTRG